MSKELTEEELKDYKLHLHWLEDDVDHHFEVQECGEMGIHHKVKVFIFKDQEKLNKAIEGNGWVAGHSVTYRKPDADNTIALICFTKEYLDLSIITHEVAHVAMFMESNRTGRKPANRWLQQHPERLIELIGNLTMVVWEGLSDHYTISKISKARFE